MPEEEKSLVELLKGLGEPAKEVSVTPPQAPEVKKPTEPTTNDYFQKGLKAWFAFRKRKFYRECLKLNPRHSSAWNNLGTVCKGEEKTRCYLKALEIDPSNELYNSNLGYTYLDPWHFGEAVRYLKKEALKLD